MKKGTVEIYATEEQAESNFWVCSMHGGDEDMHSKTEQNI
jgi:hypothetical protein